MRAFASHYDTTLANILRNEAIFELRPDLADAIRIGTLTIAQAQQEIWPLYMRRIFDAAEAAQAKLNAVQGDET
jgi:hypothetical protein